MSAETEATLRRVLAECWPDLESEIVEEAIVDADCRRHLIARVRKWRATNLQASGWIETAETEDDTRTILALTAHHHDEEQRIHEQPDPFSLVIEVSADSAARTRIWP